MTVYLDTSVLVTALTNEPEAKRVQAWLRGHDPGNLTISEWVATEFSSALSVKLRRRRIDAADRAEALVLFSNLRSGGITILPVSGSQFRTAARFADQHALGLRAGDALHLAICADHGATLCTRDRGLSEAATALGVKTTLL